MRFLFSDIECYTILYMFLMLLCLVCSEILSEGGTWTRTTIGLMFHICCEHTNCSQDSGIRGSIKLIEITGSGPSFCPDYIGRNGETKKLLSRGLAPVTRRCGDQGSKNADTFRHVIMSSHTKLSSPVSGFGLVVKTFWHLFLLPRLNLKLLVGCNSSCPNIAFLNDVIKPPQPPC